MARARPIHAGQRAIADLTIGVAKATKARQDRVDQLGLQETYLQYQLPIGGTAGTLPGFATQAITFDFPFHYAPGQRDSDLEVPHFTHGSEVDGDVSVSTSVRSWDIDSDTGAILGATIGVSTIAAVEFVTFEGFVHVTFQGFCTPEDTPDDTIEH